MIIESPEAAPPTGSHLSRPLTHSAAPGVPRQESRDSAKGFPTLPHSWHSIQASRDPTLERKKAVWEKAGGEQACWRWESHSHRVAHTGMGRGAKGADGSTELL